MAHLFLPARKALQEAWEEESDEEDVDPSRLLNLNEDEGRLSVFLVPLLLTR